MTLNVTTQKISFSRVLNSTCCKMGEATPSKSKEKKTPGKASKTPSTGCLLTVACALPCAPVSASWLPAVICRAVSFFQRCPGASV